ncbi:helix-turn-helix domain-containing protein [Prescottella defluvii]|nr:helix-turn-helix domain-containing protein [Prescottella defluvii]
MLASISSPSPPGPVRGRRSSAFPRRNALPTDRCTINHVARTLGMDRKTLYRQLARSGGTYSAILDAVRIDLAVRYVRTEPDRSLTDIAAELGFSELSAFSRWFRSRFGASPTAWRRMNDRLASQPMP